LVKRKVGKHGHAKASFKGTDLFTGKQYECHLPASHEINVPIVTRTEYYLTNIDEKYTQLVDLRGEMREDIEIGDDEISERLVDLYGSGKATEILVTVLSALGETHITDFREVQ
jgi:translation initiation factor 5A